LNPFDGLEHKEDGSRVDSTTGLTVGGANTHAQLWSYKEDEEKKEAREEKAAAAKQEKDAKAAEEAAAKAAEEKAKIEKAKKERKAKQNPLTGLIKNDDGSYEFWTGGKVSGVNYNTNVA